MKMRDRMVELVSDVQDEITEALVQIDGTGFHEDRWERDGGGGGCTRILESGAVFERAGVNVSIVHGDLSEEAARSMGGGVHVEDRSFFATGVSLVLHPHNPFAPTVHANYRYFERGTEAVDGSWWFGGGCDLTPAYLFEEDAKHFHEIHKAACDRHDPAFYPKFKTWCDDYFHIVHRGERRGIGGIFFDNLHDRPAQQCFDFVSDCAHSFLDSYVPILNARINSPYDESHKKWQRLRRGRYVEFNLVYDRGTRFGLQTNGRIESILMSLPATANWTYDHRPADGTPERELTDVLENPRAWII
jgi:coproporphyrinogen III oxidase